VWLVGRKQIGSVYLSDERAIWLSPQGEAREATAVSPSLKTALGEVPRREPIDLWLGTVLAPALELPEGFSQLKLAARRAVLEELANAALGTTDVAIRYDAQTAVACAIRLETLSHIHNVAKQGRVRVKRVLPVWAQAGFQPRVDTRTAVLEGLVMTSLELRSSQLVVQSTKLLPEDVPSALKRWCTAAFLAQQQPRLWALAANTQLSTDPGQGLFKEETLP
jgi:hypothetical protein